MEISKFTGTIVYTSDVNGITAVCDHEFSRLNQLHLWNEGHEHRLRHSRTKSCVRSEKFISITLNESRRTQILKQIRGCRRENWCRPTSLRSAAPRSASGSIRLRWFWPIATVSSCSRFYHSHLKPLTITLPGVFDNTALHHISSNWVLYSSTLDCIC